MIITIKELNHLNNIIKDIYKYVEKIDIDNGYIIIYYIKGNPNNAIKSCIPYKNEGLKEILKNLIKTLDNEFKTW